MDSGPSVTFSRSYARTMKWLAANWIALVALIISGGTFLQGRRDRRWTYSRLQEEHARRVTMGVDAVWLDAGENSKSLEGWTLRVRNDGDLPVHVDGVELVWKDHWDGLLERGRRSCTPSQSTSALMASSYFRTGRGATSVTCTYLPPRTVRVAVPPIS